MSRRRSALTSAEMGLRVWWTTFATRAYVFLQHRSSTARSRFSSAASLATAAPTFDVRPPARPMLPSSTYTMIQRDPIDKAVNEAIAADKALHSAHLSAHPCSFSSAARD